MEEIENKIVLPDGWAIDEEKSKGREIVLKKEDEPKKKLKRFIDDKDALISGFFISNDSKICPNDYYNNCEFNHNIFVTEKLAKSALAMARISQIMANDERFGGVVTDKEWENENTLKYVIMREENHIKKEHFRIYYQFLAFHTPEQRDLFIEENEQLVKDYLMID